MKVVLEEWRVIVNYRQFSDYGAALGTASWQVFERSRIIIANQEPC